MAQTKQQQIEELKEDISEINGRNQELRRTVDRFEEKDKDAMLGLSRQADRMKDFTMLLMDIITLLTAPEIIKEREKNMRNNERRH